MNQVYSPEVRKSVIELYQSNISVSEIVNQTGVSRSRVYAIIKEANVPRHRNKQSHADECSSEASHQSPRLNSDAEKKVLIDQFRASGNKTAFAREHQIPRSTLYRWSKDEIYLQDRKGTTINIKVYYEALRSKEKLQQIINVLQTVECTVSAPLQVRMEEMEKLEGQYSSRVLCAALLVDRGTYANFLKRNKREQSWFVSRRAELKQAIESIFNDHHQIPGIRKIRALLVEQGYHVSERMVGELIRRVLKPGGILYVNDFLLNTDERNLTRYKEYQEKYGVYGAFELPEGAILRHHAKEHITALLHDFTIIQMEPLTFTTMNGHKSNGFYLFGQK